MITQDRLKELLSYDPVSGVFRRLKSVTSVRAGEVAGSDNGEGYLRIMLDGQKYRAHHLAWLYMTGEWCRELDHRDCNRSNNAFSNLRAASRSQNGANSLRPRRNTSGFKGVFWHEEAQKWRAMIRKDYKLKHLGMFGTKEDAAAAYARAAQTYFGAFARSTTP